MELWSFPGRCIHNAGDFVWCAPIVWKLALILLLVNEQKCDWRIPNPFFMTGAFDRVAKRRKVFKGTAKINQDRPFKKLYSLIVWDSSSFFCFFFFAVTVETIGDCYVAVCGRKFRVIPEIVPLNYLPSVSHSHWPPQNIDSTHPKSKSCSRHDEICKGVHGGNG